MRRYMRFALAGVSLALAVMCGGCETGGQTGALAGAGVGALAGQVIGGNTEATLIGAGVGALSGYVIGDQVEKSEDRKREEWGSGNP